MTIAQTALPRPETPIETVCRLHARSLRRFLLKITFGDRREAKDLLQETLLSTWRCLQDRPAEVTTTDLAALPFTCTRTPRSG